jgi:hypothetical protein
MEYSNFFFLYVIYTRSFRHHLYSLSIGLIHRIAGYLSTIHLRSHHTIYFVSISPCSLHASISSSQPSTLMRLKTSLFCVLLVTSHCSFVTHCHRVTWVILKQLPCNTTPGCKEPNCVIFDMSTVGSLFILSFLYLVLAPPSLLPSAS